MHSETALHPADICAQHPGQWLALPVWEAGTAKLDRTARENLRRLAAVCLDSLEALRCAMMAVEDPTSRRQLAQIAAARAATREALVRHLRRVRADIEDRGTVPGLLQRWVGRVRFATSGKDPVIALIVLEHAEERARRCFPAALRSKMPLGVEEGIRTALHQVLRCHDAVYTLTR